MASQYADTATEGILLLHQQTYGPPFDQKLNVVELPNDTVPSAWAPEIAALAGRNFTQKGNYRLLANTIAHQWCGTMVSPATRNDWWLNDGFARYSEALYVEHVAGEAGFEEVTKDMSVGRAGLRHGAAGRCRQAGHVLARVSVAGHRQGRHDPEHAALGHRRRSLRQDDAHLLIAVFRQVGHRGRLPQGGRAGFRPAAQLVLHPVARFHRRA